MHGEAPRAGVPRARQVAAGQGFRRFSCSAGLLRFSTGNVASPRLSSRFQRVEDLLASADAFRLRWTDHNHAPAR